MPSRFIISLDFELLWGMRDHSTIASYGDAVLGARAAIPRMLELFRDYGIAATWATVGLLFARNQREMLEYAPSMQPSYTNRSLNPYSQVADLKGCDEATAPHFFGRSLIDRIADTGGHEIACHTYSHYFCLEPGQTVDQFKADIAANIAIAASAGHKMESIVFCRNQWQSDYVEAVADAGLVAFRGNQGGYMYRSRSGSGNTPLVRALRLADGALPLAGRTDFAAPKMMHGAWNIPASRFLRPWQPRTAPYNALHVRRIKGEMTRAAKAGTHYHLWWHPHNMGRHANGNFAQLASVLDHFAALRDRYGMESRTMSEVAHASARATN